MFDMKRFCVVLMGCGLLLAPVFSIDPANDPALTLSKDGDMIPDPSQAPVTDPSGSNSSSTSTTEGSETTTPASPETTPASTTTDPSSSTSTESTPATTTSTESTTASTTESTTPITTTTTTTSTATSSTSEPSTTSPPAIPDTTPNPSSNTNQFNGWSFFGGILLTVLLAAIGFVGFKYYKLRSGTGGRYNTF
eukprot:TRINITY_DN20997_c0_g1_i11.p1 TRINITY_DN20997_c0_g1~~TRINITY_DN20997_c0_g1_i11.p1  ORF type:complete len:206 (-),score=61.46 TRINITY_DN20997_c0_g1_i11:946-1527(-)